MEPELRPFAPEDQEFLFKVYASTRLHELAPLGWSGPQQEAFLRMQFNAQQRWYEMSYASADHNIILLEGQPVGRIMVMRGPHKNHLVDIALLSEYRNRGLGARLIGELVAESKKAGIPVGLQVLKNNPAIHLYERLGFVRTGEDDLYYQMESR